MNFSRVASDAYLHRNSLSSSNNRTSLLRFPNVIPRLQWAMVPAEIFKSIAMSMRFLSKLIELSGSRICTIVLNWQSVCIRLNVDFY